jgi:hypothetical protein
LKVLVMENRDRKSDDDPSHTCAVATTAYMQQGQRMKGCAPIFRKISLNGWDAAPL